MHFLIDADSLIYKAGCSNEKRSYLIMQGDNVVNEFQYKKDAVAFVDGDPTLDIVFTKEAGPLEHDLANIKSMMQRIVDHKRCTSFEVFISGEKTYRYDIFPDYKGKRSKDQRPIHEEEIRQYLINYWGAVPAWDKMEADDVVSIRAMEDPDNNVIVSIDKDLLNTPGWHYNYDTLKATYVTEDEANLNFYRQLLTGDRTDNITGVKGIGKIRAEEILPHPLTAERMCGIVWKVYQEHGYDMDYFVQQGQLLWMLRNYNEHWYPPIHVTGRE